MFARDDEVASLLRQATALADEEKWDEAFRILLMTRLRMIDSPVKYPAATWCKYPLYLSRAGLYQESMEAFEWLINDLPRRARKESFMDDPNISLGKGVSKKSVYARIVRTEKRLIEESRQVALRRLGRC